MRRSVLLLVLTVLLSQVALAIPPSPGTDSEALFQLADELRAKYDARRGPAFQALRDQDSPVREAQRLDPSIQLMGMDEDGFPIYYVTTNLNSARTTSTDKVWIAPYSLDGSGLSLGQVGVWDGGGVRLTHQEFGGRVIQADSPGSDHFHATHVAGTIAAAGVSSTAKGMAPAVPLKAWDWNNDESEMATAAANGMLVSNHSYGVATGWSWSGSDWYWYGNPGISPTEDADFGYYNSSVADLDNLAFNAPGYLICKSSGNDRGENGPGVGGGHYVYNGSSWVWSTVTRDPDGGALGYDTLSPKSTAKNILVVGAVNDLTGGYTVPGTVTTASFSSYGPTDDGRIKPDLVANGVGLRSSYIGSDSAYASLSGTSMSTPSVTGSTALLFEHYIAVHSATPSAATIKALLIHTCDEAGFNNGPDYRFGWGLMNTETAAATIEDAIFLEGNLANGTTDTYTLVPRNGEKLTVTLVWTDPAGSPPPSGLDPADLVLVNDLDLEAEQDATIHYPWMLDPANPALAATTGNNNRDNVEKIELAALSGNELVVRVSHEGFMPSPQAYSLIVTGADLPAADWTDVTDALLAGSATTSGVAFVDYDGDGDPDLYIANDGSANQLLRNDSGTFVDATIAPLDDTGATRCSTWGDYDNDGDLDVYLSRDGVSNQLYRNTGGVFTNVSNAPINDSGPGRAAMWVDENNDGKLDIYLVNDNANNALFRSFGDIGGGNWFFFGQGGIILNSGTGMAASWSDTDNDGDMEPYLANRGQANVLYLNGGTLGYFDNSTGTLGDTGVGMGVAWGDYNNDGLMDLYLANNGSSDRLFQNNGAGFSNISGGALGDPGNGISASWVDFDNDADLDLYVTRNNQPDLLLRNDAGTFSFVNTGFPATAGASSACAWADYDGDGDLDVFLATDGGNKLIRNDIDNGNHWIHMNLTGDVANRSAIGARVRIVAGGVTQWREVRAGEGHLSQNSLTVEFGLGAATVVDTIEIFWPGSITQTLTAVSADQVLSITEGVTVGVEDQIASSHLRLLPSVPNPFNPSTDIRFVMPKDGRVTVAVHDVSGRLIRSLAVEQFFTAGERSIRWDGRDNTGRMASSGTYFAVIESNGVRFMGRMTLLK